MKDDRTNLSEDPIKWQSHIIVVVVFIADTNVHIRGIVESVGHPIIGRLIVVVVVDQTFWFQFGWMYPIDHVAEI